MRGKLTSTLRSNRVVTTVALISATHSVWVLIQAAHVAVLYDGRMRDYYERVKKTHHSSIAITHVANKMIKIIWHMLTSRDLYRDRNEKLYQKKLKRIDAAV